MSTVRGDAAAFGRWGRRMARKVAPEKVQMLHQKIHLQLADGVIADSPVGNPSLWESPPPKGYAGGRFKGNWQTSIGQRAQGETGRIDPGGAATKAANSAAIIALQPFALSILQNNVAYAKRLNQSPPHTKQIAPGWVQRNLQGVRAQFKGPFR